MSEMLNLPGADILVLAPTPTWPLDYGNRKRIYSVCQSMKDRGARIHYLYYPSEVDWRNDVPLDSMQKMHEQWDSFYMVPPTRDLHTWAEGEDHTIDEWWDDAIGKQLEWLFHKKRFDAMIVNYTWLSKALEYAPAGTLKILDTHDRFSDRRQLLEANGIGREFFHTTQDEERIAIERADLVWAIKEHEQHFFSNLSAKPNVRTLIHVDLDEVADTAADKFKQGYLRVGILGARNNINLTNTRNFIEQAIPQFKKAMAPVKIVLAGSMCIETEDLEGPWVENIGFVDSVADFYKSVDVVAVPMTFSTGLKIKVAEAMKYGAPMISHAHASEGYPVKHPWHNLKSLEAITEACIDLAFNPDMLPNLRRASEQAQEKAEQAFFDTINKSMQDICRHNVLTTFVVDAENLKKHDIITTRLLELLDFVPWANRAQVYIQGQLQEEQKNTVRKLANAAQVFAHNTAGLPDTLIQQVDTLSELLNRWRSDHLWVMTENPQDDLAEVRKLPEILIDSCLMSPAAARSCYKDQPRCSEVIAKFNCSRLSQHANTRVVLPFINGGRGANISMNHLPHDHGGTVLMVWSGPAEYLVYLQKLVASLCGERTNIVWLTHDINAKFQLQKQHQKAYTFEEISRNTALLPKHVAFAVDMDLKHKANWLHEIIARSNVQVMRPQFPQLTVISQGQVSLNDFIQQFMWLLDSYEDNGHRYHETFGNDAGWSLLWDKLANKAKESKRVIELLNG